MSPPDFPKKRDWIKGTTQVGIFIRTKDGSTISMVQDRASAETELLAFVAIVGAHQLPAETIERLRADYEALVKRKQHR